jgi:hypothetical protein
MSYLVRKPHSYHPDLISKALGLQADTWVTSNTFLIEDERLPRVNCIGFHAYEVIDSGRYSALGELETLIDLHKPKIIVSNSHRIRDEISKPEKSEDRGIAVSDSNYVVFGQQVNNKETELTFNFKNSYYGNTPLMVCMLYLHESVFQAPTSFMDPFLGHGGSLIAGLRYGSADIVGVELDYGNFIAAKHNLETYLALTDRPYRCISDQNSYEYFIDKQRVIVFRANSIVDMVGIAKELAADGIAVRDIVSDIPWGYNKCMAHDGQGRVADIEGFDAFHAALSDTIRYSGILRLTVALHKNHGLSLQEVSTVRMKGKIHKITAYAT